MVYLDFGEFLEYNEIKKDMNSGIYMWTSPSGKSYIGQSVDLKDRKREFLRFDKPYTTINSKIERARKKYPSKDLWKYEIICYCKPTEDVLNFFEKYYIEKYNTFNNGYNSNIGGGSNLGMKQSYETRRKISESQIGENNNNYGKPRPLSVRKKISESNKGKFVSEITRNKQSKAKDKVKIAVCQFTLDGKYINTFESSLGAQRITSVHNSHIILCCKGERNHAGGYKWMYADEYYSSLSA